MAKYLPLIFKFMLGGKSEVYPTLQEITYEFQPVGSRLGYYDTASVAQ